MEKRVTLRDIAELTEVHFTTVGLALRRDPRVKPATTARVLAAAQELGYTHNAMLSALSAYRRTRGQRFAGVIAYVYNHPPEDYAENAAEATLRNSVGLYAKSQGFSLETFRLGRTGLNAQRLNRILRARGIQGVLLPPRMPVPGPMPELEWSDFSPVAVGYSITNVAAHRVCFHHAHNMRLCLRQLRSRGYKRIGLMVQQEFSERSLGIMLGSYLAEQYAQPPGRQVEPLLMREVTKKDLGRWLRAQRVDCVMLPGYPLDACAWIRELGYDVPNEMGICLISRFSRSEDIAGIEEQNDLLGIAAGKSVVSLLQHNELGLPEYPLYTMVEGRWVDGPTVRAPQLPVAVG